MYQFYNGQQVNNAIADYKDFIRRYSGDVGIFVVGQSNAVGLGLGINSTLDVADNGSIVQLVSDSTSSLFNSYIPAKEPLYSQGHVSVYPDRVGPAVMLAKQLREITPMRNRIVILPYAVSGTGFGPTTDTSGWRPSATLRTRATNALTSFLSNAQNIVALILWVQGENEVQNNYPTGYTNSSEYGTLFDAMISSWRGLRSDMANCPVVLGQMVPEWTNGNPTSKAAVEAFHFETPNRVTNSWFCYGMKSGRNIDVSGSGSTDDIHYNAIAQRYNADQYFKGFLAIWALRNGLYNISPQLIKISQTTTSLTFAIACGSIYYSYRIEYRQQGTTPWTTYSPEIYTSTSAYIEATITLAAGTIWEVRATGKYGSTVSTAVSNTITRT